MLATSASNVNAENTLVNAFIAEELTAVNCLCLRKKGQKKATLKLRFSQVLAVELLIAANYGNPLAAILKEKIVNPVYQQLS